MELLASISETMDLLQNNWLIIAISAGSVLAIIIAAVFVLRSRKKEKKKTVAKPTAAQTHLPHEPDEQDCEQITAKILNGNKKLNHILFASSSTKALPVTVAVNVAVQLANHHKRCLLIDVDVKRDALAKVFEIDNGSEGSNRWPRTIKTNVENLWIWPARNFIVTKQMNVTQIVNRASKEMDFILINAPALASNCDRSQIIAAAQGCFVFSANGDESQGLGRLLDSSECNLIENIKIATSN